MALQEQDHSMDYHFGHLDVSLGKFQKQVDGVALHLLGGVT